MSAKFSTLDLLQQTKAFEYVVGTLRGRERYIFQQQLANNISLQHIVHFWEEELMALPAPEAKRPAAETWPAIEKRLHGLTRSTTIFSIRRSFWQWMFAGFVTAVCLAFTAPRLIAILLPPAESQYLAILTDSQGHATLTALTQGQQQRMEMHWQKMPVSADKTAQLWAVSRRDGQPRSLAVFKGNTPADLSLNQAQWRLVQDAEYLLLTEEEDGGSAIDEPSDIILAKGVCVRLPPESS